MNTHEKKLITAVVVAVVAILFGSYLFAGHINKTIEDRNKQAIMEKYDIPDAPNVQVITREELMKNVDSVIVIDEITGDKYLVFKTYSRVMIKMGDGPYKAISSVTNNLPLNN